MARYIWYSGATDVTGQALADELNISGTKTKPRSLQAEDIIIGWGTKTRDDVQITGHIINHPNAIKLNRNKLKALELMSNNRDLRSSIAVFCASDEVVRELGRNNMVLPLIGRTNFHQGGKGFWLCLTKQHIERAINDGAQYFQSYIDIKYEYRLHVAFGSVIYAVKKIENPTEAGWISQRKEKILHLAQKNNIELVDHTLDYVLQRLAKEVILPDRIVRSNKRGWKFSSVRLNNVSEALKNAAIKSVEVVGLDFGAVDCAIAVNNMPYIIEINSGPGLQGTALQKYVEAFTAKMDSIENQGINRPHRAANIDHNRQQAAVGAENAAPNNQDEVGLARIMQNVQNNEEARAVIDILMANR
jgi:hypothetical protein